MKQFDARKRYFLVVLFLLLALLVGCGGGSASDPASSGALAGNWQFIVAQEEPTPRTTFGVSGFLQQSGGSIAGSVIFPATPHGDCGGVASVTGTVKGNSISFTANEGATALSFTGTTSSAGTGSSSGASMSGTYQGLGGGCFDHPTIGTWTAAQVPTLTGNFTGSLTDDSYMPLINGSTTVQVSGTLQQSPNIGSSSATVTGAITAVGYPCFSTAGLSGTITGSNVNLALFGYNGEQIGTIGTQTAPATVSGSSSGTTLTADLPAGLILEVTTSVGASFGPCPPVNNDGALQTYDTASIQVTLSQ